jgi:murein DD-endopeptidase MepM/ murein hydrolase activator NlpD
MNNRLARGGFLFTALVMLSISSHNLSAAPAPPVEIRFCPASVVRTYPLESRRDLHSIMLQNFAVLNRAAAPFKINGIEIELLRGGQVLDAKKLDAAAVEKAATRGAKMQEADVLKQVAFQFCGTEMIPDGVKLGGATLARDQALLVGSQAFAFSGARDTLRVRVRGTSGGKSAESTRTIQISAEFAKNTYIFPLRGVSYVGVGATFHTAHRWAIPEEFGLDIARVGENGLTHRGDGTRFEDYYAYGAEILATADGTVVEAVDGQSEDPTAMQRPDETQEAYFSRLLKEQDERMGKGSNSVTGNYVLIDHGQNEYSMSAHLQPGSVRVKKGKAVKAGDVIGKLGSSGNSTEPHLHFQLTDKGDSLFAAGIPLNFSNIIIQWADVPRPIQSGDVVIAR